MERLCKAFAATVAPVGKHVIGATQHLYNEYMANEAPELIFDIVCILAFYRSYATSTVYSTYVMHSLLYYTVVNSCFQIHIPWVSILSELRYATSFYCNAFIAILSLLWHLNLCFQIHIPWVSIL